MVVVTVRVRSGGGKEEGSGGIGRRGGDRRGGVNAPRNNNGAGIRAGVKITNLTYYRDRV